MDEVLKEINTLSLTVNKLGKFEAMRDTDPSYPAIDVEFIPEKENGSVSRPRMRMEYAYGQLRVLVWADKDSEDYTDCITIKM